MGYLIYQVETEFFIPKNFKFEAFISIKNLVKNSVENKNEISFVEMSEIECAETLEEVLAALRWIPENNESGDIIEVNFTGEKLGDDYQIFESIAGSVENESFITLIGDDGETMKLWRWLFLDGNITEKQGKLIFD